VGLVVAIYSVTVSPFPTAFWAAFGAMDIPTDLPGILSEFGLPAGAIALAYGLIKGADALEKEASDDALTYISRLLKKGPLTVFGPLGGAIVPFVFDKVFGKKLLSVKFVLRSFLASIFFWLVLILIRQPDWEQIWHNLVGYQNSIALSVAVLTLDYCSLVKSRLILDLMLLSKSAVRIVIFVILDVILTFALVLSLWVPLLVFLLFAIETLTPQVGQHAPTTFEVRSVIDVIWRVMPFVLLDYAREPEIKYLSQVFVPSTMLTSIWVIMFMISGFIVGLLYPLEYLRRFTLWWFKDIDAHPLRAIAKVAATLIVFGAFALKIARWGWSVV
jgi:hypothetical protein